MAIIGNYNIGGDAWSSRILLEEMGLRVIAQWSGDCTLAELEATPKAKLMVERGIDEYSWCEDTTGI